MEKVMNKASENIAKFASNHFNPDKEMSLLVMQIHEEEDQDQE